MEREEEWLKGGGGKREEAKGKLNLNSDVQFDSESDGDSLVAQKPYLDPIGHICGPY